jgi:2-oxoglutarate ferredoxin oxidoreductase subunit alpha
LRTPVVVLSDKEVGMTMESVGVDELVGPPIFDRTLWQVSPTLAGPSSGSPGFLPYGFERSEDVPAFAPIPGGVKATVTGSAHDAEGRLRKNAPEVIRILEHLQQKMDAHTDAMALSRTDYDAKARLLLVSYGITARAAQEATVELRGSGIPVSFFQPLTLFPIPRRDLNWVLAGIDTVIVAEENLTGQYRAVLQRWLDGKRVLGVNKIGSLITPGEIAQAVRQAAAGAD